MTMYSPLSLTRVTSPNLIVGVGVMALPVYVCAGVSDISIKSFDSAFGNDIEVYTSCTFIIAFECNIDRSLTDIYIVLIR